VDGEAHDSAGRHALAAHDPRHRAEADLRDKGLSRGSVGLISSVVLGISSVAPAYALTATLGLLVTAVGLKAPAIFIAGFIPMFLTAYGYRELNKVAPDCGSSFTWATKAFGPYIGWMCGWGLVVAIIIVLSNLAGVAVSFFYLFIARLTGVESIADLAGNKPVNVLTCLTFVAIATLIAYRGITATERVQYILVGFQMVMLVVFVVMLFIGIGRADNPRSIGFSLDWFHPFTGLELSAFVAGVSASIFAFWGWDTSFSVNEESRDSDKTPGRAGLLCVVTILVTYLVVAVAAMMYAGIGGEGTGLGNEATTDNVFAALAGPTMGGAGLLLFLAVLASSAASLQTTFLPASRTLLRDGTYRAIPPRFASVHPRFRIPAFATLMCGIGTSVFYTVLTIFSQNVLSDTIAALGIMICFYYGLTAFACVWYFRKELFASPANFVFKFAFPLVGGLMLATVFVILLKDSFDPSYGSGASIAGVGLVFVLGLGVLVLGGVLMLICRARYPAFFRGETLAKDTPSLVVAD